MGLLLARCLGRDEPRPYIASAAACRFFGGRGGPVPVRLQAAHARGPSGPLARGAQHRLLFQVGVAGEHGFGVGVQQVHQPDDQCVVDQPAALLEQCAHRLDGGDGLHVALNFG